MLPFDASKLLDNDCHYLEDWKYQRVTFKDYGTLYKTKFIANFGLKIFKVDIPSYKAMNFPGQCCQVELK